MMALRKESVFVSLRASRRCYWATAWKKKNTNLQGDFKDEEHTIKTNNGLWKLTFKSCVFWKPFFLAVKFIRQFWMCADFVENKWQQNCLLGLCSTAVALRHLEVAFLKSLSADHSWLIQIVLFLPFFYVFVLFRAKWFCSSSLYTPIRYNNVTTDGGSEWQKCNFITTTATNVFHTLI